MAIRCACSTHCVVTLAASLTVRKAKKKVLERASEYRPAYDRFRPALQSISMVRFKSQHCVLVSPTTPNCGAVRAFSLRAQIQDTKPTQSSRCLRFLRAFPGLVFQLANLKARKNLGFYFGKTRPKTPPQNRAGGSFRRRDLPSVRLRAAPRSKLCSRAHAKEANAWTSLLTSSGMHAEASRFPSFFSTICIKISTSKIADMLAISSRN
jgi:hypothetical protein